MEPGTLSLAHFQHQSHVVTFLLLSCFMGRQELPVPQVLGSIHHPQFQVYCNGFTFKPGVLLEPKVRTSEEFYYLKMHFEDSQLDKKKLSMSLRVN